MSIGIDFILKANTAAFTKGLAAVDNATSKLQKSLAGKFEGRDLARGLTTALGLSVDKIAEKFARMWTGVSEEAEKAYARMGQLSDTLTKKVIEAGTARLSTEQKYQLALIQTEQLQNRIARNTGSSVEAQNQRMEDQIALIDKEREAEELLIKSKNEKIDASNEDVKKQYEKMDAEKKAAEERDKDARAELKLAEQQDQEFVDSVKEKFAPTVEQLGQMEVGTGVGGDDPRIRARRILEKEALAAAAGSRGDITAAMKLGGEATAMRESLSAVTGGGTALTAETAETALRKALEDTNKKLVDVETALAGIIRAQ